MEDKFKIESTGLKTTEYGRFERVIFRPEEFTSAEHAFKVMQKCTLLLLGSMPYKIPNNMRQFFSEEDLKNLDMIVTQNIEERRFAAQQCQEMHQHEMEEKQDLLQQSIELQDEIEGQDHDCGS